MKRYLPLFLLTSCATYNIAVDPTQPPPVPYAFYSETASRLFSTLQKPHHLDWRSDIEKIRNAYTRVIRVLDEKEAVQFSLAFFKALAVSEELDQQALSLSGRQEALPNTEALKFFYKAERELEALIASLADFTRSSNPETKECAVEVELYLQYQKDLYADICSADYRFLNLKTLPPEILRANAKLLQQREQLSKCLIAYYNRFSD